MNFIARPRKLQEAGNKVIETIVLKNLSASKATQTAKIFHTIYKIVLTNQSFNSLESEIDLQELNGLDMGRILHSTNACSNIINHIACEEIQFQY